MLEILLCSLFTILPDYLYRRYRQGKRFGHEITLFSVWFELRWGIVGCLMLAVGLITVIFYNHPTSTNVTFFYRTVPIVPEVNGRVAEVFVKLSDKVEKGAPLFRLDSTSQQAAVETARRKVQQVEAGMVVARSDIAAAEGQIQQAQGALDQALDELRTKQELMRRNADNVATREIERLQNVVTSREGAVAAARAGLEAAATRLSTLLPAEKASAEAALAQSEAELAKTTIRAGVEGRVEQFALQVGDIVNPFARPAGVLIPYKERRRLVAGFSQIEAQVMRTGMVAEATCISKPWAVIPLVVTDVQAYIAAGQFRGGDQLVDPMQVTRPGSVLVIMDPLYEGGLDDVAPGSSCIANAYTSNHELIASGKLGTLHALALHGVDAVGVVHAVLLRIQAAMLPIRQLVLNH